MHKINLSTTAATDTGQARQLNEDVVFARQHAQAALLIVADGMGGHQAGEVASALAVETITQQLDDVLEGEADAAVLQTRLEAAVKAANAAIIQYGQDHPNDAGNLGTTVAAAIVHERLAIVANVGDSRTYLRRADTLVQVSEDHSYVGELARAGVIEMSAVYDHPQRSLITRALGDDPNMQVDLFSVELAVGDQLLLCSDGLWEMVRDENELVAALRDSASAEIAAQTLIALANKYGGEDNIGVAIATLAESDEQA